MAEAVESWKTEGKAKKGKITLERKRNKIGKGIQCLGYYFQNNGENKWIIKSERKIGIEIYVGCNG